LTISTRIIAQGSATDECPCSPKVFNCPSDWQLELRYDGAVGAVNRIFQSNLTLMPGNDAFRRHVSRALVHGPLRSYFWREEYHGVYTVADLGTVPTRTRPLRNQAEQDIITRDLLKQVAGVCREVSCRLDCAVDAITRANNEFSRLKFKLPFSDGLFDGHLRRRVTSPCALPMEKKSPVRSAQRL
jgi:hypothetical protein